MQLRIFNKNKSIRFEETYHSGLNPGCLSMKTDYNTKSADGSIVQADLMKYKRTQAHIHVYVAFC